MERRRWSLPTLLNLLFQTADSTRTFASGKIGGILRSENRYSEKLSDVSLRSRSFETSPKEEFAAGFTMASGHFARISEAIGWQIVRRYSVHELAC